MRQTDRRTDRRNCDSICELSIYAVARKKNKILRNRKLYCTYCEFLPIQWWHTQYSQEFECSEYRQAARGRWTLAALAGVIKQCPSHPPPVSPKRHEISEDYLSVHIISEHSNNLNDRNLAQKNKNRIYWKIDIAQLCRSLSIYKAGQNIFVDQKPIGFASISKPS